MRTLQLSFGDNKSTSKRSSKTGSKTLNQRKQDIETVMLVPVYFQENRLITEMTRRTKQKIKKQHIKTGYSNHHLTKAKNIIESLRQKQEQAVKRLEKLKAEAKIIEKEIYPFQPKLTKPEKYIVHGDIVRRNQIWLQEKKKRNAEKCQSSLFESLHECTFSPHLVSKEQSDLYLKNRSHSQSVRGERKNKRLCEMAKSPLSHRKQMSPIDYEAGKREIFQKLFTLRN